MKYIQHILFLAAIPLLLSCSCWKSEENSTYKNADIGLTISYSTKWQVMKADQLHEAISAAEELDVFSEDLMDITKESAPFIVHSVVRPRKASGINQNASIYVMVIPVFEEEYETINLEQIQQEQIEDIKSSTPDVKVVVNAYPLVKYLDVLNYSTQISLPGRRVTQFQYMYWHQPYIVIVGFSFTHQDDEQEIKAIINNMKIST